jgi:flagellar protein FlaF
MSQLETYGEIQKAGLSDRELEASVLTKAALRLKECKDNWDDNNYTKLDKALKYNQQIWSIFQGELVKEDNALPRQLKLDLLRLSIFIDKRTFEVMAYPEPGKLTIMININLNLAAGLRTKQK